MKTIRTFLTAALCIALASCEDSFEKADAPAKEGTFILNNGRWGDNNAGIGIYSPTSKTYLPGAFIGANGQRLGDLGQDIAILGEDLYIAVYGSQTIFVTDMLLNIRRQINADIDGTRLSPRAFAICGDRMYVTYYEGYAGELSPGRDIRLCKVGPNPEGIASALGTLYVANSGGMLETPGNTVSVVPLDSFMEEQTIEVNPNPIKVEASSDGAYVYVSSYGNYSDRPAMLQAIETATGEVTDLEYDSVSGIAKGPDDILYILCAGYDQEWNPLPGKVFKHDMKQNRPLGNFVADGTVLPEAYSISVARDGYIYIGCSDYTNTGDVYVFSAEGRLHDKFDSQGLNPVKAL